MSTPNRRVPMTLPSHLNHRRDQGLLGLPLSEQELQVLTLAAIGLTNREIGRRLHISGHTVKSYLSRVLQKLGAVDRTNAVALAIWRGLLPPPAGVRSTSYAA